MPPASSPVSGIPEPSPPPRTPSPLIPALSNLGFPVLDLASTLTIEANNGGGVADISLQHATADAVAEVAPQPLEHRLQAERRRNEMLHQRRQQNLIEEARERRRHEQEMNDIRQRLEIDDSLEGTNRSQDSTSSNLDQESRIAYGDRIPNSQSLYDWAPAVDDREEEFEDILDEMRQQQQQQPNSNSDILTDRERAPYAETESRYRYHSSRFLPSSQIPAHETSLRSAAILQSVRRNYRSSARSRDLVQRWAVERDRVTSEILDDVERPSSSRLLRDRPNPNESSRYEFNRLQWQAIQRLSTNPHRELESYRRRCLDDTSSMQPSKFEKAIERLRWICSVPHDDESALSSFPNHQPSRDDLRDSMGNLTPNSRRSPQLPETSWLAPGASYRGYQHAHHTHSQPSSSTTLYRLANNQTISSTTIDRFSPSSPNADTMRPWLGRTFTSSPQPQNQANLASNPNPPNPSPLSYDHWSVKVSIHAVDYYDMTLSGSMEAYNVHHMSINRPASGDLISGDATPQSGPEDLNSNIAMLPASSTFLEGEIIDFDNHTLFTESYESHPHIDATYWSKLEPFKGLKDDELGKNLLNREWIEEEVVGKYVLMRWKEKCFIKSSRLAATSDVSEDRRDSERQNHEGEPNQLSPSAELSINGFYYVSLRRKDGHCEGLYCDPKLSTPYQHLQLQPEVRGKLALGSWGFR